MFQIHVKYSTAFMICLRDQIDLLTFNCQSICNGYYCVSLQIIRITLESQAVSQKNISQGVKSSHLYLYCDFYKTDCIKAASQCTMKILQLNNVHLILDRSIILLNIKCHTVNSYFEINHTC